MLPLLLVIAQVGTQTSSLALAETFDGTDAAQLETAQPQPQPTDESLIEHEEAVELTPLSSGFVMDNPDPAIDETNVYETTPQSSQFLPEAPDAAQAEDVSGIPKLTTIDPNAMRIAATAQAEVYILKTPVVLQSNLRHQFVAYEFSIENHWHAPVELLQTQVVGSVDPEHGYLSSVKRPKGLVGGVFGGDGTTNTIGAIVLGATSAMSMASQGSTQAQNNRTAQEANQFVRTVPQGMLQSGQRVTFKVLAPGGTVPELRVTFKDTATNTLYAIAG